MRAGWGEIMGYFRGPFTYRMDSVRGSQNSGAALGEAEVGRWACRSLRVLQALIITSPKSVLLPPDEALSVPRHCPLAPGTAQVLVALGLSSLEVGGAEQWVRQVVSDHGKLSPIPGSNTCEIPGLERGPSD